MKQKSETGQTVASGAITDIGRQHPSNILRKKRSWLCLTTYSAGQIESVIDHSNHQRYHESINNLTQADH